jgi:hypothetical protein
LIPGHWHFLVTAELEFSFGKSTNLSVIGLAPQLVDFGQSHLEVCILNVSPDGQVLEYAVLLKQWVNLLQLLGSA